MKLNMLYLNIRWKLSKLKLLPFRKKFAMSLPKFFNLIQTISNCDLNVKVGIGSYGTFHSLKDDINMGVKIAQFSIKETVIEEFTNLQKAYAKCPDLFPKPGNMVMFLGEDGALPRYGYTMENVKMTTLHKIPFESQAPKYLILNQVSEFLAEEGIHHRDLHNENLLYCPHTGDFKVIDLDPTYVTVQD